MGKLIAATLSLTLAIALGTMAVPLALWAGMASYRPEWASGWALWALERSPLPLYAAPMRVATDVMQRDFLVAASLAATVLCLMAFSALRSTRRALRSPDESHDGKATIGLKTQALRVGRPVEGSIWLAQRPGQGEVYRVQLSCSRGRGPGKSDDSETAYWEELEVAPVPTPVGWSLPFRFVVPPIAPPSGVSRFMSGPGYHWRLAVRRGEGWMSFPSVFALHLAPAPAEELYDIERRERREPELKRPVPESQRPVAGAPAHDRGSAQQPAAPAFNAPNPGQPHESARAARATAAPQERANRQQSSPSGAARPGQPQENPRTAGATAPAHDRAGAQQLAPAVLEEVRRAAEMGLLDDGVAPGIRSDARPPERPELPDEEHEVRSTSVVARVAKWLFLAIFGGALAVSAVAFVTAVLLGYVL